MRTQYVNEYKETIIKNGIVTIRFADVDDFIKGLYANRRNPQTGGVGFFRLRAYVVRRPSVKWSVLHVSTVRITRPKEIAKVHPFDHTDRRFFTKRLIWSSLRCAW